MLSITGAKTLSLEMLGQSLPAGTALCLFSSYPEKSTSQQKDRKTLGAREKREPASQGGASALVQSHRGMQAAPSSASPTLFHQQLCAVDSTPPCGRHSPLGQRHLPSQHAVSGHLSRGRPTSSLTCRGGLHTCCRPPSVSLEQHSNYATLISTLPFL